MEFTEEEKDFYRNLSKVAKEGGLYDKLVHSRITLQTLLETHMRTTDINGDECIPVSSIERSIQAHLQFME